MKKALLLDRDGVINEDQGRVYKVEDIIFMDGIFDVCRKFLENNYLIIIITNQAGIGRGLYTESDFEHLTQWMEEKFQSEGVEISKTYFCPFHPTEASFLFFFEREAHCQLSAVLSLVCGLWSVVFCQLSVVSPSASFPLFPQAHPAGHFP